MNNTKKMVLIPYQEGGDDQNNDMLIDTSNYHPPPMQSQIEAKKGNSIRRYAAERQHKLLLIILKLAQYGGYDESGQFKTAHGESIDVVPLLAHASSPGRNVKGMNDFIELLYSAKVPTELIINVNVREALMKRYSGKSNSSPNFQPPKLSKPIDTVPSSYNSDEKIPENPQSNTALPPPPPLRLMVPPDDPRVRGDDRKLSSKRKRTDDDEGDEQQVIKHKNNSWDDNDSDLDD